MPAAPTRILYQDREILVLHRPGPSDHSLVTFADLTFRPAGEAFWGRDAAVKLGLDAVGFVAKRENWYPVASVEAAAAAVRAVLKPRSVAYGYSMGAYGALKHGARLGIGSAIAVAPQASIAPGEVPADRRFHRFFRPGLHRGMRVSAADLAPFSVVMADPYDEADWAQARLVAEAGPAHLLRTPHAGHSAIWLVTGSEALAEMMAPALAADIGALHGVVRARRARSGHWFRLMGRAAWSHGHAALAERLWARARELGIPAGVIGTERALALAERAQRLVRQGRRAEAVAACRDLLALAPEAAGTVSRAAHLLLAAGAVREAEVAFRRALLLKPDGADLHVGLSLALSAQDRPQEAMAAARAGHAALPDDADLATHYAHLLRDAGAEQAAEAEGIFRAVLARHPGMGLAHDGLARVLARRGAVAEAVAAAEQAVIRLPGQHDPLELLARLLLRGGEPVRAERMFRRLQRQSPSRAEGYLGLAEALAAQGRRMEAIGALRRGLTAVPGDAALASRLRELIHGSGILARAVARLRKAFGRGLRRETQ